MPRPSICEETIKQLTDIINDQSLSVDESVDGMIIVLKQDSYWQMASEEQCLAFIINLLKGL